MKLLSRYRLSLSTLMVIISWIIALFGLIVYINALDQYYLVSRYLFVLPDSLWKLIQDLGISPDIAIRFMTWGTAGFLISSCDFTLHYTGNNSLKNMKWIYFFFFLWFLTLVIVYDPVIYTNFYQSLFNPSTPYTDFINFYSFQRYFDFITSFINLSLYGWCIFSLIRYYIRNRKYAFLDKSLGLTTWSMIIIFMVYAMVFSWAPTQLKTVAVISQTIRYQRIDLGFFNLLYGLIPYIMLSNLIFALYIVYNQRRFLVEHENENMKIIRDIDVAKSSSRIFMHSVKNQLVSILGDTEQLSELVEKDSDSFKLTETIKDTVLQTIKHINDLHHVLDNAQVQLVNCELDQFILSLNLEDLSNQSKSINLNLNSKSSCLIDENMLKEALLVIIKNGLEALPLHGGQLTIETQRLDRYAIINIKDTGKGIPKHELERIFDPFYSTKPSRYNWGVGLTFSKKIILAHHGKISVESEVGKGTTFMIFLPLIN